MASRCSILSFLLIGVGLLFPWNAIINSMVFFRQQLNNERVEFLFSVAYMTPNLIGLIFVLMYGQRVTLMLRIVTGFLIYVIVMTTLVFMTDVVVGVSLVGVLGLLDAIVQGSAFGLAGMHGSASVGAVMAGNGVAGTAVSGIYVIALLAAGSEGERVATVVFFAVAGVILFSCAIVAYWVIASLKRISLLDNMEEVNIADRVLSVDDDMDCAEGSGKHALLEQPPASKAKLLEVMKTCWREGCLVCFNFIITLSVFPALAVHIPSNDASLNPCPVAGPCPPGQGTAPVVMGVWLILTFSVFDMIGRTLPKWQVFVIRRSLLPVPVLLRLIYVPLFILLVMGDNALGTHDSIAFAVEATFALTNGYCATSCMVYGTGIAKDSDKESAGAFMVLMLTLGLTIGVWLGLLIDYMAL